MFRFGYYHQQQQQHWISVCRQTKFNEIWWCRDVTMNWTTDLLLFERFFTDDISHFHSRKRSSCSRMIAIEGAVCEGKDDVCGCAIIVNKNEQMMISSFSRNFSRWNKSNKFDLFMQSFVRIDRMQCDGIIFYSRSERRNKVQQQQQQCHSDDQDEHRQIHDMIAF